MTFITDFSPVGTRESRHIMCDDFLENFSTPKYSYLKFAGLVTYFALLTGIRMTIRGEFGSIMLKSP